MPIYKILRPVLFLLPPEFAHKMTLLALNLFGRVAPLAGKDDYIYAKTCWGMCLPTHLGWRLGLIKTQKLLMVFSNRDLDLQKSAP